MGWGFPKAGTGRLNLAELLDYGFASKVNGRYALADPLVARAVSGGR
jgi:hypothetical protein